MPAGDLPDEFAPPMDHSSTWLVLALVALAVVGLYYLAVTMWARPRRPAPPPPAPTSPPPRRDYRREHLDRLDAIEREVNDGALTARDGHQQVSATVRAYVARATNLPADTMTLADLRAADAGQLTDTVALMYPPSFAPRDEGHAAELFPEAVARAREVVRSWT